MDYTYVIFILISLILFSCSSQTIPSDKFNGVWLNKALIDTLFTTRSTFKATKSSIADISDLDIHAGGINGLYGFHSSFADGIEELCLTNKPYVYTIKGKDKDTIYILDKDSCNVVMFSFYNHNIFVRINEPIHVHINKIVIAGKYQDNNGNKYYFNSNGSTNWPKKGYNYELCIDYNMIQNDCIMFSDSLNQNKIFYYGYSWKDSTLRFHKEIDYPDPKNTSEDYKDFKTEPFIQLTKIKP
jgi:hypothetical protein